MEKEEMSSDKSKRLERLFDDTGYMEPFVGL